MEAKAVAKYVRISPQKARLVVDLVRGKKVEEAQKTLLFTRKVAAGMVGSGSFAQKVQGQGSGAGSRHQEEDEPYHRHTG
jgi:ribosomal protein L22